MLPERIDVTIQAGGSFYVESTINVDLGVIMTVFGPGKMFLPNCSINGNGAVELYTNCDCAELIYRAPVLDQYYQPTGNYIERRYFQGKWL